jgi:nucleoside phosphorylase
MMQEPEHRADVLIVTAIALEYEAVLKVDDGAETGSSWKEETVKGVATASRSFLTAKRSRLQVVVALAPDMATAALLATLIPLIGDLRPRCIAMCGVCAGRPGKVQLGDVVAAERLYYHDTGKQSRAEGKSEHLQQDLRTFNLRPDWKSALERMNAGKLFRGQAWLEGRPLPGEWRATRALWALLSKDSEPSRQVDSTLKDGEWKAIADHLRKRGWMDGSELTDAGKAEATTRRFDYGANPDLSPHGDLLPFKLHVAPMASGNRVIEDEKIWAQVASYERKTLGLDMEAAALGAAAHYLHDKNLSAIVMKGVMDFANHGRDDHFKEFAARASAECLLWFLRHHLVAAPKRLPGRWLAVVAVLVVAIVGAAVILLQPSDLVVRIHVQTPEGKIVNEGTVVLDLGRPREQSVDRDGNARFEGIDRGYGNRKIAIEYKALRRYHSITTSAALSESPIILMTTPSAWTPDGHINGDYTCSPKDPQQCEPSTVCASYNGRDGFFCKKKCTVALECTAEGCNEATSAVWGHPSIQICSPGPSYYWPVPGLPKPLVIPPPIDAGPPPQIDAGTPPPPKIYQWRPAAESEHLVWFGECLVPDAHSETYTCDRMSVGQEIYLTPNAMLKGFNQGAAQGWTVEISHGGKAVYIHGQGKCGADDKKTIRVSVIKCTVVH